MLRHITRVEPITLVTTQKTPKWRFKKVLSLDGVFRWQRCQHFEDVEGSTF